MYIYNRNAEAQTNIGSFPGPPPARPAVQRSSPATSTGFRLGSARTSLAECVPVPVILTPAQVTKAVPNNATFASALRWGNLRDQIEVNLLGCARAAARLSAVDFAQAVALFQRNNRLAVDGILGPNTWQRMKDIQAERDPLPRFPISLDFDNTRDPDFCEGHIHPAIDIVTPGGTAVAVVADGVVRYAGAVGSIRSCDFVRACRRGEEPVNRCIFLSYGQVVIVEHPNKAAAGQSAYTVYAHLRFRGSRRVSSGEPVKAGRLIGEVGSGCVGFSTGPHLHYVVATGPKNFRFDVPGPSRCVICVSTYCSSPVASCPRCVKHFWNLMTPRRPRTTAAAAFRW